MRFSCGLFPDGFTVVLRQPNVVLGVHPWVAESPFTRHPLLQSSERAQEEEAEEACCRWLVQVARMKHRHVVETQMHRTFSFER